MQKVPEESCEENLFVSERFRLNRGVLQRSRDSGALSDCSSSSHSPTLHSSKSYDSILEDENFVTIVSVNDGVTQCADDLDDLSTGTSEFITVLRIGEQQEALNANATICLCIGQDSVNHLALGIAPGPFVDEITYVDRLPEENKLGFGLKFDGGLEKNTKVNRLFIQCCADDSPASRARCSWGAISEADEIVEIRGEEISQLTRSDIVSKLTQGSGPLQLLIRHWVDETQRENIVRAFLRNTHQQGDPLKSKASASRKVTQERAIDVPLEYLQSKQGEDVPPPVPPRRRKRPRPAHSTDASTSSTDSLVQSIGVPCKPPRTKHALLRRLADEHGKASTCAAAVESRETCLSKANMNNTSCETVQHEQRPAEPKVQQPYSNERLFDTAKSLALLNDQIEEISIRHLIIPPPPPPEVYVNLIAEEDQRLLSLLESESESDTSSSISTVVDCWSLLSHTVPPSPVQPPFALKATMAEDLEGTEFLREILRENASFMDQLWRGSSRRNLGSPKVPEEPPVERCADDISPFVIEPPASFSDDGGGAAIVTETRMSAPSNEERENHGETGDQALLTLSAGTASPSPEASKPTAEPSGGIEAKTALNGSLLKGLTLAEGGGGEEKPEQHSISATVACLERPPSDSPHHPPPSSRRVPSANQPPTAKSVGIVKPILQKNTGHPLKSTELAPPFQDDDQSFPDLPMESCTGTSKLSPEARRLSQSLRDVNSRSLPTWRRDEPSEKSVRDKIALFTSETDSKPPLSNKPINRSVLSPSKTTNHVAIPILGAGLKPLSNKKDAYTTTTTYQTGSTKRAPNSNFAAVGRHRSTDQLGSDSAADNPRIVTRKPADSLAERSKSLLDVTTRNRNSSPSGNPPRNPSVTDLAERRRKTLSRLRGLVIPDNDLKPTKVVQLPKIISKESVQLTRNRNLYRKLEKSRDSAPRFSESRLLFLGDSKHQVDETSDTDSAVSSGRSFSPPESPVQPAGEDPRILKPHSIEALNRRNVLQSAKCSSGGTADPEPDFTNRETPSEFKDSWERFNYKEKSKSGPKSGTLKEQNLIIRTAYINEVEFIPNYPTDASIDNYSSKMECDKPMNKETVYFTEKRLDMSNFQLTSPEVGFIPRDKNPVLKPKPAGLNRATSEKLLDCSSQIRSDSISNPVSEPRLITSNQTDLKQGTRWTEKADQVLEDQRGTCDVTSSQSARRLRAALAEIGKTECKDDITRTINTTTRGNVELDSQLRSEFISNEDLEFVKVPQSQVAPTSSKNRPRSSNEDSTYRTNPEPVQKSGRERPGAFLTTELIKDGTGLGFSLDGGKDSSLGDRPLTIKKIFTGGPASKNVHLKAGDEIISIKGQIVGEMSRIEAWNFMKKLPDGVVTLVIKQNVL